MKYLNIEYLWKTSISNMTKLKTLIKNLQTELSIINEATVKTHLSKELTKQLAILEYKKLQLIKLNKPVEEISEEISNLSSNLKVKPPKINEDLHEKLVNTESPNLNQLSNIINYLKSQRIYTELVERYNPGLAMDQEDKIRRTANRVGLSIPETK